MFRAFDSVFDTGIYHQENECRLDEITVVLSFISLISRKKVNEGLECVKNVVAGNEPGNENQKKNIH